MKNVMEWKKRPVPEIIDPVFVKTSPKRSFSMTEYERFVLVFTNTRVYKYGHGKREGKKIAEVISMEKNNFERNFVDCFF